MTALAFAPNGVQKSSLSNLIEEWFDNDFPTLNSKSHPSTNLIEYDDHYLIQLSVPGYQKSDFSIQIDSNELTISTKKKETSSPVQNYRLREFSKHQFTKSFNLSDTIELDKITATCVDGILAIQLPKKEEAKKKPPRTIDIK
ncbi:MAG: Hsp20/alpha crystallin family protein [Saprospiraceae bacterium]|nr:Hsp20/alpha crystallin family protein [Saprospiraceae bacterium]